MSIESPDFAPTVEERWAIVEKFAPEAYAFYLSVVDTDGSNLYWWKDKPLQVFTRAILEIGNVRAQLTAAQEELAALRPKAEALDRLEEIIHDTDFTCLTTYVRDSRVDTLQFEWFDAEDFETSNANLIDAINEAWEKSEVSKNV